MSAGRSARIFSATDDSHFFQAFNRNKRSITLNLRAPEAQRVLRDLVRRPMRCSTICAATSRRGSADLRSVEVGQSAHRLRASVGVWPRGQPRGLAGLRLSDAGGSRLPVADRRTGQAAGALRTVDRRHDGGRVCGDGAPRRHRVGARDGRGARRRCQPVRHGAGESELPGGLVSERRACAGARAARRASVADAEPALPHADGWIFIMCNKEKFWPVLCEKLGRPEWSDDPRFASFKARLENRAELTRAAGRGAVDARHRGLARRILPVRCPRRR